MDIATSPREHLKINLRKLYYYTYLCARRIMELTNRRTDKVVQDILFYPTVSDREILSDLVNRVAWYFTNSKVSSVEVKIPVTEKLLKQESRLLAPPKFQKSYLGNVHHIELIEQRDIKFSKADLIMIWSVKSLLNPRIWPYLGKTCIVDPTFFSTIESRTYQEVYIQTVSKTDRKKLFLLSKRNYRELQNRISGSNRGYVFGTGPSLDCAYDFDYSNSFCIVCNSVVKNKYLLSHIKPQLLVFADPVFHFSPCFYAAEFRRMMVEVVDQFNCYIMLPDYCVPLLLAHYPQLKTKVIGMPKRGKEYNFPTLTDFYVRGSKNILTSFMLPVASSMVDEIYIIGADGRKQGEKYFWQHSASSQFSDLMQTAFKTHPSFFRDRIYDEYYNEHCKFLEGLVLYGERLGKKYYSLTHSFIPALAQRQVSGGQKCRV